MTDQNAKFAVLRDRLREWGADFRSRALDVDKDPDVVDHYLDLPAMLPGPQSNTSWRTGAT